MSAQELKWRAPRTQRNRAKKPARVAVVVTQKSLLFASGGAAMPQEGPQASAPLFRRRCSPCIGCKRLGVLMV
jgi:hypothetical protein